MAESFSDLGPVGDGFFSLLTKIHSAPVDGVLVATLDRFGRRASEAAARIEHIISTGTGVTTCANGEPVKPEEFAVMERVMAHAAKPDAED